MFDELGAGDTELGGEDGEPSSTLGREKDVNGSSADALDAPFFRVEIAPLGVRDR